MSKKLRRLVRRLQFQGGRPKQPYVALPARWARDRGLKQSDEVLLYWHPDSDHLIVCTRGAAPLREVIVGK